MNQEKLYSLYDVLLAHALKRGVPFQDAEEMVHDVFLKTLDAYDPERGNMKAFCYAILNNRINTFWRDRKPNIPFDENDSTFADSTQELQRELQESKELVDKMLDRIERVLDPEELKFLKMLREVVADSEDVVVSEAARRLGLTVPKGWNMFRRIKRKARHIAPAEPAFDNLMVSYDALTMDISQDVNEKPPIWRSIIRTPERPRFFKLLASLSISAGFEEFYKNLGPERQYALRQMKFSNL